MNTGVDNMNEDMIIDTTEFDFSMLDEDTTIASPEQTKEVLDSVDDDTEDFEDFEYEEDEEVEDAEESEIEDLEAEDDSDSLLETAFSNFADLDDDLVVTIGDKQFTKKDLQEAVLDKETITTNKQMLDQYISTFDQERVKVESLIFKSLTETELAKDTILRELNDPNVPQVTKGAKYEQLRQLEAKEQFLNQKAQEYQASFNARQEKVLELKFNELNKEMSKAVPDWSTKQQELGAYLAGMGLNNIDFIRAATPALLQSLLKAMKYDKVTQQKTKAVQGKLLGKKANIAKSKSTSVKSKQTQVTKKQAIAKRMASGMATHEDLVTAFDFLED